MIGACNPTLCLIHVFRAKIVKVRSTNIRRTQLSTAALLLGMWPIDSREDDAVVAVEVFDPERETMYPLPSCARHKELFWEKRYSLFADAEREWGACLHMLYMAVRALARA